MFHSILARNVSPTITLGLFRLSRLFDGKLDFKQINFGIILGDRQKNMSHKMTDFMVTVGNKTLKNI